MLMIYDGRVTDNLRTYVVEVCSIDRSLKVVVRKVGGDRMNAHSHFVDARGRQLNKVGHLHHLDLTATEVLNAGGMSSAAALTFFLPNMISYRN